ncbi:MAG TPA: hypothetical protein VK922_18225 [Gemmatimonadaceae bacterium]|nr:hypothetical protein [Gemmatimonadaceae bacterium]
MAARITPYEALLAPLEAVAFPPMREEAEQRGSETRRRDQFVLLGAVGATLRDIVPDDAPPDALEEYAELLYHAYQFWAFGKRLYVLAPGTLEALTDPRYSIGEWIVAGPPSCYVQFPAQRVWARVSPESPFEPVDGCFIVVDDTAPAPQSGAHLRALLVLGLRPERPGISLVSYRTDLDPRAAADHAEHPWREGAEPFGNAIPGGERQALHAIATTSELEALVLRVLHYLDRHPARLVAREPDESAEDATALPWTEVLAD